MKKCNCGYEHIFGEDIDIPIEHDRCPNCDKLIWDLPQEKNWVVPKIENLKLTKWNWCVSYIENFELGNNVDIGMFSFFQAKFGIKICNNVKIGSHCSFYSEDTIGNHKGGIILEEGCKIGTHSTILPGVSIGPNLIIPAYSFIKKSILTQKDLDKFLMKENKRHFILMDYYD